MEPWQQFAALVIGSGAVAAIVAGLFSRGKTRADAFAAGTGAQSQIILDLQGHIARLDNRLQAAELQIDTMAKSEQRKGKLIELMQAWQRRAYRVMTDDQKLTTGEPPTEADLAAEAA